MKTTFLTIVIVSLVSVLARAQDFPFGAVSLNVLNMKKYDRDTAAGAVVLQEFGEASIDNGDGYHLIFKYHVRIKILNKNGLGQANLEIPLYKQDNNRYEKIIGIKASSFNFENGRVREEVLQDKDIFTENRNKFYNIKKFAIPNIREGSVIEISYTMDSPFVYNFRPWKFQSDIPKIESEFWASIPGVYRYSITLKGFQELSKNESIIVKNCLGMGAGGYSADCAIMKYGMKNIPAFVEEDYMTSKNNFISSIHFELSEIRHFDGRIDKVTKEWKDVEQELRQDMQFGGQLKRGKDLSEEIKKLVENELDELTKAKKVYEFIKGWYLWNDTYGKYSELGIKKAFDEKTGNVGDINLSLVAALRFAGLDVEPVILSTRTNGVVTELFPVLTDFNYVIAKVTIGDKTYLADATDKFYPFGLLPERCLNGKGRVLGDRSSYWIDLKPAASGRTISLLTLKLGNDGVMRGSLQTTYSGYAGVNRREEISAYASPEAYIKELKSNLNQIEITGFELKNPDDFQKPVILKLEIEITAFDNLQVANFIFNPYILDKWSGNPFKSNERMYPVDFGAPIERTTILQLEYPSDFKIVNIPENLSLSLPNSGGRYILETKNIDNKLTMNNFLSINKTVFSSAEYHYLKELFSRILQVQNGELIFQKKI